MRGNSMTNCLRWKNSKPKSQGMMGEWHGTTVDYGWLVSKASSSPYLMWLTVKELWSLDWHPSLSHSLFCRRGRLSPSSCILSFKACMDCRVAGLSPADPPSAHICFLFLARASRGNTWLFLSGSVEFVFSIFLIWSPLPPPGHLHPL